MTNPNDTKKKEEGCCGGAEKGQVKSADNKGSDSCCSNDTSKNKTSGSSCC